VSHSSYLPTLGPQCTCTLASSQPVSQSWLSFSPETYPLPHPSLAHRFILSVIGAELH
jgi:hypothetical protein